MVMRSARRLSILLLPLLLSTAGASAKDLQASPETLPDLLAQIQSGDNVLLAPGEYTPPTGQLPAARYKSTGGETTWQVPPAGWKISGDAQFIGIVFWSSEEDRQASAFQFAAGSEAEFDGCRFAGLAGSPAIAAKDSIVRLEGCTFFHTPQGVTVSGTDGAELLVTDSEFIALPQDGVSFLHLNGNTIGRIEAQFVGGGSAITADDLTAPLAIEDCFITDSFESALSVQSDYAPVELHRTVIGGSFRASAVQLVGQSTIKIADVSADDIFLPEGESAFVETVDFGTLNANRIQISGRGNGAGMRLLGDDSVVKLANASIEKWNVGVELRGPSLASSNLHIEQCDTGLLAEESKVILNGGSISDNRTGVSVTDGATARVSATVASNREVGISVGSRAELVLRTSKVLDNALGILIAKEADGVDLGTQVENGANVLRVPAPTAFAIRNEGSNSVTAFGNRWFQNRLEYLGHVAIDDLIDDGDVDNPIGEAGNGEVYFEIRRDFKGSTIHWDSTADRRTLGYGSSVYRSREEVEARAARVRTVLLGPGEYPPLERMPSRLTIRGKGADQTRLVAREGADATIDSNAAQLSLEGVAISFAPDGPETAISWRGGELKLQDVDIDGFPAAGVVAAPGRGSIEMRNVRMRLLDLNAQPLVAKNRAMFLHNVSIGSQTSQTAIEWSGDEGIALSAEGLSIETGSTDGAALHIVGSATLRDTTVHQLAGTGLLVESPSPATNFDAAGLEIHGFSEAGVRIAGTFESAALSNVELRPKLNPSIHAEGIDFSSTALGAIEISDLSAENVRPGLAVRGTWTSGSAKEIRLRLGSAYNAIDRQEDGILFDSRGHSPETFLVTAANIEGYDSGIHLAPDHDNPTSVTLGNFLGTGASRFRQNSVGIRLSSASGALVVKEDRNRALISGSGVGVLVEAGNLKLENERILQNTAGIIVRGGTADLGGGPFQSRGANLLWPQSGSYGIINETPQTVMARGNYWGEAEELMPTEARPIRDSLQDPSAGPVITSDRP
ncbi:DUF1565 domain-containing protein [bacterium]|nr:DUF1565 domain-containing protein [bacterium]